MKRTINMPDQDPSTKAYPLVPVGEHRFRIIDVTETDEPNTVSAKCEVTSETAKETSLLHRFTLDENIKFFFLTRIFLKCIGEPCRGNSVLIDTDNWIGRQFYGRVEHSDNGKYANIKQFIFKDEPQTLNVTKPSSDVSWEE